MNAGPPTTLRRSVRFSLRGSLAWVLLVVVAGCTPILDLPADEAEVCDDRADNDLDGRADCADPECAGVPACAAESECADGLDNDADGVADCEDRDCVGQCPENTESSCSNDLDDDGDGTVDRSDPSCFQFDPPVQHGCASSPGMNLVWDAPTSVPPFIAVTCAGAIPGQPTAASDARPTERDDIGLLLPRGDAKCIVYPTLDGLTEGARFSTRIYLPEGASVSTYLAEGDAALAPATPGLELRSVSVTVNTRDERLSLTGYGVTSTVEFSGSGWLDVEVSIQGGTIHATAGADNALTTVDVTPTGLPVVLGESSFAAEFAGLPEGGISPLPRGFLDSLELEVNGYDTCVLGHQPIPEESAPTDPVPHRTRPHWPADPVPVAMGVAHGPAGTCVFLSGSRGVLAQYVTPGSNLVSAPIGFDDAHPVSMAAAFGEGIWTVIYRDKSDALVWRETADCMHFDDPHLLAVPQDLPPEAVPAGLLPGAAGKRTVVFLDATSSESLRGFATDWQRGAEQLAGYRDLGDLGLEKARLPVSIYSPNSRDVVAVYPRSAPNSTSHALALSVAAGAVGSSLRFDASQTWEILTPSARPGTFDSRDIVGGALIWQPGATTSQVVWRTLYAGRGEFVVGPDRLAMHAWGFGLNDITERALVPFSIAAVHEPDFGDLSWPDSWSVWEEGFDDADAWRAFECVSGDEECPRRMGNADAPVAAFIDVRTGTVRGVGGDASLPIMNVDEAEYSTEPDGSVLSAAPVHRFIHMVDVADGPFAFELDFRASAACDPGAFLVAGLLDENHTSSYNFALGCSETGAYAQVNRPVELGSSDSQVEYDDVEPSRWYRLRMVYDGERARFAVASLEGDTGGTEIREAPVPLPGGFRHLQIGSPRAASPGEFTRILLAHPASTDPPPRDGDPERCGPEHVLCAPDQLCKGGACVCLPGTFFCDGHCVSVFSSKHCGACGRACTDSEICDESRTCRPAAPTSDCAAPGRLPDEGTTPISPDYQCDRPDATGRECLDVYFMNALPESLSNGLFMRWEPSKQGLYRLHSDSLYVTIAAPGCGGAVLKSDGGDLYVRPGDVYDIVLWVDPAEHPSYAADTINDLLVIENLDPESAGRCDVTAPTITLAMNGEARATASEAGEIEVHVDASALVAFSEPTLEFGLALDGQLVAASVAVAYGCGGSWDESRARDRHHVLAGTGANEVTRVRVRGLRPNRDYDICWFHADDSGEPYSLPQSPGSCLTALVGAEE